MSSASQVLAKAAPAAPKRSLRANFIWIFAGNGMFSVFQWMILVALAKLGSPLMLGQFSLGLAVASPVVTFANLQLRVVQATDAHGEYKFADYFGLRTLTTAAGFLVIVLIAMLGHFEPGTRAMIMAVAVAKSVESLSDVFYGLFQRHEDLKRLGISMMLRGALAVAAFAGILYFTHNVLLSTLAMAATWGLIWAAHDVRWGGRMLGPGRGGAAGGEPHPLRPAYEAARHLSLLRLAAPLGLVIMLVALNLNIPRYFVQYHQGEEILGIFSAMAYAMVALTGAAEALAQSATPKLANYLANGQHLRFRSLLLKLLLFVIVLGAAAIVGAVLFGRTLLAILYMPRYAMYSDVFVWLSVGAAFTGIANILSSGVTAARHFGIQVPMFAAVALTSTVGCYFLVPSAGMRGAAMAAAAGSLLHVLLASGLLAWVVMQRRRRGESARHAVPGERGVLPLWRPEC